MKKVILIVTLFIIVVNGYCQPVVGGFAPNIVANDINGKPFNLYEKLDSGYSVLIDVSAAWCGPCWSFHSSQVMEHLMDEYGPNGTVQKGKITCLFIEGESQNTTAQLYGPAGGTTYADKTQGNWVAGTNYPIIDNSSFNSSYLGGGFPTMTLVCPDRSITYVAAGYSSAMAATSFWYGKICSAGQASASIDVKAVRGYVPGVSNVAYFYTDADSIAPVQEFYNYSTTNLTSATLTLKLGSTTLGTYSWTGNAKKDSSVKVTYSKIPVSSSISTYWPSFTSDVTAAGDVSTSNNTSTFTTFVYTSGNAKPLPFKEDFESVDLASTTNPYFPAYSRSMSSGILGSVGDPSSLGSSPINKDGSVSQALFFAFGYISTSANASWGNRYYPITIGNFSIPSTVSKATVSFEYAKKKKGTENDSLKFFVIDGKTLTYLWAKGGDNLVTNTTASTATYIPKAADWVVDSFDITAYKGKNNLIIGYMGYCASNGGGNLWLDNINLKTTTSTTTATKTFQLINGKDSAMITDTKTMDDLKPTVSVKNIKGSNIDGAWKVIAKSIPTGWDFQICDPVLCHAKGATSGTFTMDKDSTGSFYVDFLTSKIIGEGYIHINVWNVVDSANSLTKLKFRAKQKSSVSIVQVDESEKFYVSGSTLIIDDLNSKAVSYSVTGLDGRKVFSKKLESSKEELPSLPKGIYIIQVDFKDGNSQALKIQL